MRICLLLLSILTTAACTPGVGPLYIASINKSFITPMIGTCGPEKDPLTNLGVIDVAAGPDMEISATIGGVEDYFAGQQGTIVSSGQILAPASREHLTVQKVFVRYASKPAIPGLTPGPEGQAACIAAGKCDLIPRTLLLSNTSSKPVMQVPLFGNNARAKLEALSASNLDSFQFTVTFEIQGISEPAGSEFRTPPVSIPLTLVKSEVTCAAASDQRLKRYINPAPATRGCNFIGATRRFGAADCCNNPTVVDPSEPGCDVAP